MKKSQTMMEYLMTYGWAILVVLIALGSLFYLGVFNPNTYCNNNPTDEEKCRCTELKVNEPTTENKVNFLTCRDNCLTDYLNDVDDEEFDICRNVCKDYLKFNTECIKAVPRE